MFFKTIPGGVATAESWELGQGVLELRRGGQTSIFGKGAGNPARLSLAGRTWGRGGLRCGLRCGAGGE